MKVNFTRKPTKEEIYPQTEFVIEKVVTISPEEFKDLIDHPLEDRSYVKENKSVMYEDCEGYQHCIYVVADGYAYGILIQSEGSDYPRYTAYVPVDVFKF